MIVERDSVVLFWGDFFKSPRLTCLLLGPHKGLGYVRQHRTVRIFNLVVSRVQIRDCHMFVVLKTKQTKTKTQNILCYET